ncbi:putative xyloglucan glycosyltransferase 1 [Zea mays]|uniref:Putative xyloglucan glycosyltransferase 1 n=1 Tax=Zea mays TaxID=4577 RepID=A0A317YHM0_MAIZE|nr:putative xyloglucan glycosyltransferase 1 [Zea mays]
MPQWWGREAQGGSGSTSVVVKMQSPDWAVREPEATRGKAGRGKNARQITWVLLLKAHRAAGKLTGAASAVLSPSTPSSPRAI